MVKRNYTNKDNKDNVVEKKPTKTKTPIEVEVVIKPEKTVTKTAKKKGRRLSKAKQQHIIDNDAMVYESAGSIYDLKNVIENTSLDKIETLVCGNASENSITIKAHACTKRKHSFFSKLLKFFSITK